MVRGIFGGSALKTVSFLLEDASKKAVQIKIAYTRWVSEFQWPVNNNKLLNRAAFPLCLYDRLYALSSSSIFFDLSALLYVHFILVAPIHDEGSRAAKPN